MRAIYSLRDRILLAKILDEIMIMTDLIGGLDLKALFYYKNIAM